MFFAALMMAALLQPGGSSSCVSRSLAAARTRSQNSDHRTFRPGVRPMRMTAWIARSRCAARVTTGSAPKRSLSAAVRRRALPTAGPSRNR